MKRDLETIKRQREARFSDDMLSIEAGCTSKRPCTRSTSESRVYKAICIFCNKDRFLKGSKSREKLTQAVQLRTDKTLRECAIQKGDEKIIGITSRDIVAAEAFLATKSTPNSKPRAKIMRKEEMNRIKLLKEKLL